MCLFFGYSICNFKQVAHGLEFVPLEKNKFDLYPCMLRVVADGDIHHLDRLIVESMISADDSIALSELFNEIKGLLLVEAWDF